MLRCPKCNRTYQDDMQKFCTHDGGRLVPDIEQPKNFDPNATVHADLSNLDIPVTPASRPPAQDMNATLAGPPPAAAEPPAAAPPSPPPSSPPAASTGGFRSSDTAPTGFPQTTKLGEPPPRMDYPPQAAAPQPRAPEPPPSEPVQQPGPPAQLPTIIAPPPQSPQATSTPVPSAELPGASTPLPHSSAALPPAGSGQFPTQSSPLPAAPTTGPIHVAPAKKKSKLGLILALAGALVLLLLVAGGVGAYFYLNRAKPPAPETPAVSVNPTLDSNSNNANNNTASEPRLTTKPRVVEAPPNSVKFENSASNLDGKLAEHYVDFYFYYPQSWQKNAKAGVPGAANFVEVERKLPPDFTQENLTVSWYESKGTVEADLAGKLPALIKEWDANFAKTLPEYQKVSEGKTTINGIDGYELRFKALSRGTEKGDLNFWGRVIFLPPGDEESTKGVTLLMLTTSLAPELHGVDDVGSKGELAMLLNTFTLGKSS